MMSQNTAIMILSIIAIVGIFGTMVSDDKTIFYTMAIFGSCLIFGLNLGEILAKSVSNE